MTDQTEYDAHDLRISRLGHTADIVRSVIERNTVATSDVPALIADVHKALVALDNPGPPPSPSADYPPAVTLRKSLANPAEIISMIDGKGYKMLRRHLATNGLTPEEYKARYHLPADYPMTAPDYAAKRRELALAIGLGKPGKGGGRKPGSTAKPK